MSNTPNYEPTAWMRKALSKRLAEAVKVLRDSRQMNVEMVIMPLAEPPQEATDEARSAWEFTCDRCGADCRGQDFHTGGITVMSQGCRVTVTFGLCSECRQLEDSK